MVIQKLTLSKEIDMILGFLSVAAFGLGWASSIQVRCTSVLIIPSMFTKEGRFYLSTLVYTLLLTGM